ncbi:mate-domain-containing protein [Periconia macrospinosa]|uniref:Mate-domain-containing protein n=1 Tax=Periconia macrospinosa TaxID=97972 RepID=A0A2V1DZW5_9PLEO|nr:mate-domain-containing protein [Periconia macrospinosa]
MPSHSNMKHYPAVLDSQRNQSDVVDKESVGFNHFNSRQASPVQTSNQAPDNIARASIVTPQESTTVESDERYLVLPTETTSLLNGDEPSTSYLHWSTTWRGESKMIVKSSGPLIITFVLQYSLPIAMSASITGYVVYTGLASSLDTLCSQPYGAGRFHLVGLHFQRMLYFLLIVSLPIAALWFLATRILLAIVPTEEEETARLAGLYLRILVIGTPAYATFEAGKRYLQAQSLFNATMYTLLFLSIYPIFNGYQCWGGFNRNAFSNWMPMIKLAVPGLIMLLAEFLAYEILTLSAGRLGSTSLASQSVPFSLSVASSTRIANLVGARELSNARFTAKVTTAFAVLVGLFNFLFMVVLKGYIPHLFTHDEKVVKLVSNILPLWACNCNRILRALGKQKIGGIVGLLAYYVVGLPISIGTGFSAGWGLFALWTSLLGFF